MNQIL